MAKQKGSVAGKVVMGFGAVIGLWAVATLFGGLSQAQAGVGSWSHQFMTASGMMSEQETLVEYYTHIKGIEYLICLVFFVAYPVFYYFVNKEKKA